MIGKRVITTEDLTVRNYVSKGSQKRQKSSLLGN